MKPGDFVTVLPPFDIAAPGEHQILSDDGAGTFRLECGDFAGDYLAFVREGVLPGSRQITRLGFRNRFTPDEKVAIYTAAGQSAAIRVWLDDLMVAESVDLDNLNTVIGVQALEQSGLIAAGRANEILGV